MRQLRRLPIPVLIVVLIITGVTGCKDVVFNNPLDPDASKAVVKIERVIETPVSGRGDLMYDGEKFWKIDDFGNLTALDRESGTVIRSFSAEPGTGVAFFRDVIYFCNADGGNILNTLDPLSGDIINRIPTTDISPAFLSSSNDQLVVYDLRSAGIFYYEPDSGVSQRLFGVAGLDIGGIAAYKDGILISDMNTDSIYRFTWNGEVKQVFSSPVSGIGGIAVDESNYVYIFILEGKLYKVSLP